MGFEAAARVDQQHHAVEGEEGYGEEQERAHDPAGFSEGIGEAENSGAYDGDENIGKGLGLGGEMVGFGD